MSQQRRCALCRTDPETLPLVLGRGYRRCLGQGRGCGLGKNLVKSVKPINPEETGAIQRGKLRLEWQLAQGHFRARTGAEIPPGEGGFWLRLTPSTPRPARELPRAGETSNTACPKNRAKWDTRKSLESREVLPTTHPARPVPTMMSVTRICTRARCQGRSGVERAAPGLYLHRLPWGGVGRARGGWPCGW